MHTHFGPPQHQKLPFFTEKTAENTCWTPKIRSTNDDYKTTATLTMKLLHHNMTPLDDLTLHQACPPCSPICRLIIDFRKNRDFEHFCECSGTCSEKIVFFCN